MLYCPQALLVSQELIRVAILWHEMWHEGLEEASRQFFGEKNIEGMFNILEPLHQKLERVCSSAYAVLWSMMMFIYRGNRDPKRCGKCPLIKPLE